MNSVSVSGCSNCASNGLFDPEKSTSYTPVPRPFLAKYEDGEVASGTFATDTIILGGLSLSRVEFGLASKSHGTFGILGLGSNAVQPYPVIPWILFKQKKLIDLLAFSLWLNAASAKTGLVLFGGINVAKFEGKLTTLKLLRQDEYSVRVDDIFFSGSSPDTKASTGARDIRLDSGYSFNMLPVEFFRSINIITKGVWARDGQFYVKCGLSKSPMYLQFNFGPTKIRIPLAEFILPDESNSELNPDDDFCVFTIRSQVKGGPIILGVSFLRSAYVVYDMTNSQLSVAKVRYTSASNIAELSAGGVEEYYQNQGAENKELDSESGDGSSEGDAAETGSLDTATGFNSVGPEDLLASNSMNPVDSQAPANDISSPPALTTPQPEASAQLVQDIPRSSVDTTSGTGSSGDTPQDYQVAETHDPSVFDPDAPVTFPGPPGSQPGNGGNFQLFQTPTPGAQNEGIDTIRKGPTAPPKFKPHNDPFNIQHQRIRISPFQWGKNVASNGNSGAGDATDSASSTEVASSSQDADPVGLGFGVS